ncbi:MAG TPA: endonuclease III [Spirochaetia bacterium]|nr:endonuclease III [Spirochaetia bacterium]
MGRPAPIRWAAIFRAMRRGLSAARPEHDLPSVSAIAREDHEPFRVLVSTLISLRTRDEVTERASRALFALAPTPARLAALPAARIERAIYPAGFYRTKAKNLCAVSRELLDRHGGAVPSDMEELLALPGVGRKTANLVRNLGFGLPGICVDTHVHRISHRMGWVDTRTPDQTEMALRHVLPRRYWIGINELLVRYGQAVCTPLSPRCSACLAGPWCARVGVEKSR